MLDGPAAARNAAARCEVMITGLGVVGPHGVGAEVLWEALLGQRTVFGAVAPTSDALPPLEPVLAAKIGAFSAVELLGRKGLRAMNLESQILSAATALAMRDARLDPSTVAPESMGVFVGTVRAGLDDYIRFHVERLVWGPSRVTPTRGPNTGFNAPASHAAIRLGLKGPNLTFSSRTASSLDAVAYAADFIARGQARFVIAGGIDTFSYAAAKALEADQRRPKEPPRPYDARRLLPVPGEGAAMILLESAQSARERGVRPLASVGAWSMAFEPAACGASIARASVRSLRGALAREEANRGEPLPIDAIFSSAAGDRGVDAAEALALGEVLGDAVATTPVCAVKGATGEWDGASGALQVLVAARSIAAGVVPPTAGTTSVDPELPPIFLRREPFARRIRGALVHVLDASGRSSTLTLCNPSDGWNDR